MSIRFGEGKRRNENGKQRPLISIERAFVFEGKLFAEEFSNCGCRLLLLGFWNKQLGLAQTFLRCVVHGNY